MLPDCYPGKNPLRGIFFGGASGCPSSKGASMMEMFSKASRTKLLLMRKLTSKWILYRGQKVGNGLNDDRIGCIRPVHKRSEVTKISGEEMSGMAAHSRLEDNSVFGWKTIGKWGGNVHLDRAIRSVRAARRGREPGYLVVRLRSASLRAASLVNSKKCPAAPSSMTKAAFPRGLWWR